MEKIMTAIGQEISIKDTKTEEENHTGYIHLDTKEVSIKKKEFTLAIIFTAIARRIEKGQASLMRDRILTEEEMLTNPVNSRKFRNQSKEDNMQMVLRDTQQRFRKLLMVSYIF